ncbi:MAG: PIG-L deacetylase family protein [Candidatus Thorarchaeota archaeon]
MKNSDSPSILVICAHPDDECIGAGGTIAVHSSMGIPVDVQCLTANQIRKKELEAACKELGVRKVYSSIRDDFALDMSLTKEVANVILESRPAIIITHSPDDYNQNHVICCQIVEQAAEWASHKTVYENAHRVERIYHMEINTLFSHPNVMMDISGSYDRALSALLKYKTQIAKSDGFYTKLYDARTRLRGVQSSCGRAEAFTVKVPYHAGPFYEKNSAKSLF